MGILEKSDTFSQYPHSTNYLYIIARLELLLQQQMLQQPNQQQQPQLSRPPYTARELLAK